LFGKKAGTMQWKYDTAGKLNDVDEAVSVELK
jgi:hypothetical protein